MNKAISNETIFYIGQEVVLYFKYTFIIYYFLLIIILLNTVKSINTYININKNNDKLNYSTYDIATSILIGIGQYFGLRLVGAFADVHTNFYANQLIFISLISFLLFIIQIIFYNKSKQKLNSK